MSENLPTATPAPKQKRPSAKRSASEEAAGAAPQKQANTGQQPRLLGKEEVVRALANTTINNESQYNKDLERRFIAFLSDLEMLQVFRHQKAQQQSKQGALVSQGGGGSGTGAKNAHT